jgi:hypothetical protein
MDGPDKREQTKLRRQWRRAYARGLPRRRTQLMTDEKTNRGRRDEAQDPNRAIDPETGEKEGLGPRDGRKVEEVETTTETTTTETDTAPTDPAP